MSDVGRVDGAIGLTVITVDADGDNSIAGSAGANDGVDDDVVAASADAVEDAHVCLLQLEIPDEGVLAAARRCNGTVILNPAPARTLPPELLETVDILVPNEHELSNAVRWACGAGAAAATREGAQASLPSAADVREPLGRARPASRRRGPVS